MQRGVGNPPPVRAGLMSVADRERARRRCDDRTRRDDGDGAAPLTLVRLLSQCDDVRLLLGRHMDAATFRIASRLVCKAPLVEPDQASFDRLLWSAASPAEALRIARFLRRPHLQHHNPILAAGPAGWDGETGGSEHYCTRALDSGSLELLAWARARGCPWSDAVRDAVT